MKKVGKSKNTQYSIRNTYHKTNSTKSFVRNYQQIMPNKPNVKIDKISLSIVMIKYYDSKRRKINNQRHENKPSSNPSKPNLSSVFRLLSSGFIFTICQNGTKNYTKKTPKQYQGKT
jgi:hypothetical protein